MVSIRSNRLLPLIGSGVLLMTVFVGFKACSNSGGDGQGELATVPEAPAPDADTPAETIRTLTARVADMTTQMKALRDENAELKRHAGDLRRSITEQVMTEVKAEQARQAKPDDSPRWSSITARLDDISRQVTDLMTDKPLPVGQGLEEPSLSTGLVWTEPLNLPKDDTDGFSGLPHGLLRGATRQAGDRKAGTEDTAPLTRRIESKSKEPEPIPYYTVPRNATLIGSTGMTALIGRIPVKGRVEDPIPFKLIVGKDNLAANGLTIPHVAGMIWSGVAVGDSSRSTKRRPLMGRKRTPGLYKRNGVWHIDKQVRGRRLCESTGESDLARAEEYLARRVEDIRQAVVYGVRPKRTFRQAATKYLNENQYKRRIVDEALYLKQLDPYIEGLTLDAVHMGTLQGFIQTRQKQGIKSKSINLALGIVRHILNAAASEWLDENNLTWLQSPPKIKLLPVGDLRKPYPLSWEKQTQLFKELPPHLARMALFKVNTGCREPVGLPRITQQRNWRTWSRPPTRSVGWTPAKVPHW